MNSSIQELLTRGVDKIYPSKEELETVLKSGKKLRIYQGFDPTGDKLHIGHMIGLRKLAQWQKLGHHVIFLIGDGTGQAGDPSGKTKSRDTFFTRGQLRQNAKDYVMQAARIMNFEGENAVEILYNGDWLNKLTLPELLEIINHLTWQQLSERDLFQERAKNNVPVNMREFIYPILQGYDSVAMEVDLEVGGTDQMFNMLVGRTLLKQMKKKDKFVMTTPLLADSEGKKIGKTTGNAIAITDKPEDLFAKIMSLGDDVIIKGLEYLTDVPMDEVKAIEQEIQNGSNPIVFKKKLAFEIVKQLNSDKDAKQAQRAFESRVQQKELPEEMQEVEMQKDEHISIAEFLVKAGLSESRSDAKRLIEQGGVTIDGNPVANVNEDLIPEDNMVVKVGKRRYAKIRVN